MHLRPLELFNGSLELQQLHMGSLQDLIAKRRQNGVKTKAANVALGIVRRSVNLSVSEWMGEKSITWLETALRSSCFRSRMPARPIRSRTGAG